MTIAKVHLLIIDPQNDFSHPSGSLFVQGADKDMPRVAAMIDRLGKRLDDIIITLDSHHVIDISHPGWFKDSKGNPPAPFTMITLKDLENGVWTTQIPSQFAYTLKYLKTLEQKGNHVHVIWPEHCLIGSWGNNVHSDVFNAVSKWERNNLAVANYVSKGSSIFTEHYGAIEAECPLPNDPTTQLNFNLIKSLETECDMLLVCGEAFNFCVKTTVNQIIKNFSNQELSKKIVLLTDGMSDVPGFEKSSQQFTDQAVAAGIQFSTTVDVLK